MSDWLQPVGLLQLVSSVECFPRARTPPMLPTTTPTPPRPRAAYPSVLLIEPLDVRCSPGGGASGFLPCSAFGSTAATAFGSFSRVSVTAGAEPPSGTIAFVSAGLNPAAVAL